MPICEVCSAIDLFGISELDRQSHLPQNCSKVPVGWRHHATYRDLRLSAATCPSCALFYQESNADAKYPNKPPINDNHGVYLFALAGDDYPRQYLVADRPASWASLLGLKVAVESVHGNLLSYSKKLDLWIENGNVSSPLSCLFFSNS
jgi:hypothetical protein